MEIGTWMKAGWMKFVQIKLKLNLLMVLDFFLLCAFYFEFLISKVGLLLIFKIFSIKVTCYSH